jgi:hypothetical protein
MNIRTTLNDSNSDNIADFSGSNSDEYCLPGYCAV